MIKRIFRTDADPALLVVRLALGSVMFAHGAQKVLGWFGGAGLEKTLSVFTSKLHLPLWLALAVIFTEFLGSLGLLAGFFTRLSALGIGSVVGYCAYLNHFQHGFFMNWFGRQKGEGFEFHVLVMGIALALVYKGGGFASVDRTLGR